MNCCHLPAALICNLNLLQQHVINYQALKYNVYVCAVFQMLESLKAHYPAETDNMGLLESIRKAFETPDSAGGSPVTSSSDPSPTQMMDSIGDDSNIEGLLPSQSLIAESS